MVYAEHGDRLAGSVEAEQEEWCQGAVEAGNGVEAKDENLKLVKALT